MQPTIESEGTSVVADAPANVTVKPVLTAPVTFTVPGKPAMPFTAAAMLPLLTASPPAPSVTDVLPPSSIWNDWVAALKPVSVTCCTSLPPRSALAMPAWVSFCPRTIGTVSAPL